MLHLLKNKIYYYVECTLSQNDEIQMCELLIYTLKDKSFYQQMKWYLTVFSYIDTVPSYVIVIQLWYLHL